MDPDLVHLAHRVARSLWHGVRLSREVLADHDDLRQEATLAAWRWAAEHPDWNADSHSRNVAARAIRCDVIDAMRVHSGKARQVEDPHTGEPVAEFPRQHPRSLDEPVRHIAPRFGNGGADVPTLGSRLADKHAGDALEAVERAHDVRRAFIDHAEHRGHPRHAAAAWLALHGHSLADIGAYFGVTESRACQYRTAFIDATAERWAAAEREAEQQAA